MQRFVVSKTSAIPMLVSLMSVALWLSSAGPCSAELPILTHIKPVGSNPRPAVKWYQTLREGWLESSRRNVPMLIYISSDPCVYCDAMQRDTWCDRSVQDRISHDFVAIHLTPQQNEATLGRIKITTYPTTLIGMPEGKIVGHRLGYQPAAVLHQFLSETLKR
ncbi:thioredoxin family protein [Novipirellula artificiosorum]|uniref:Uncharacterized protein n=1 Tax=Novipirellula artificiosorum TaxID=2528016 RepID=A0A5C6DZ08_9BACT|nr:thioredoxin family protein [Novipirellula artificiosorum]TWU41782.1 hypothetical protein Poly41_00740 [Novipirellula artificiosorum]